MKMQKSGFTLLELIIVLFLITLVTGLSSLFFVGALPSSRMNAAGREITGLIRQARSLARLHGERQTVWIDLDRRTYGIEGREARSFPPDVAVRVSDPLAGEVVRGAYPIVLNPTGGMGGGTLILSRGHKSIRIDMDPITGAVLIKGG